MMLQIETLVMFPVAEGAKIPRWDEIFEALDAWQMVRNVTLGKEGFWMLAGVTLRNHCQVVEDEVGELAWEDMIRAVQALPDGLVHREYISHWLWEVLCGS